MKIYLILSAFCLGSTGTLFAQEKEEKSRLKISGYTETYYIHDFNRPLNNTRPSFIYSHTRTGEVNVNLAYIKAAYNTEVLRTNLTLATGTYMNANYTSETGVLKNMYEANIGVKISKKHNLWIDAGLLPSHIGFESAVGADNWTLTRGLYAENSPYFETGAKISYTSSDAKWFASALILNGWQRIQRIDGNTTPAFGHQLTYIPNDKITLNSSSFIGNDQPDSLRKMRYFHNLYMIYKINKKIGITGGFDIGAEQKEKSSDSYNIWYTPVFIAKYQPKEKLSLTARLEYYNDENSVIVPTVKPLEFKTFGYSFNADYHILPNLVWRTELRNLRSKDKIFLDKDSKPIKNNFIAITAIAITF